MSVVWDDLRNVLDETRLILDRQEVQSLAEPTQPPVLAPLPPQIHEPLANILLFTLGESRYGWPVASVKGIVNVDHITPVPSAPRHYRGVTNIRGQILSVLDLQAYLKLPPLNTTEEYMVIIDGAGLEIAVLATAVYDVVDIPLNKLTHASSPELDSELITGIYADGLRVLDATILLQRERQRINARDAKRVSQ